MPHFVSIRPSERKLFSVEVVMENDFTVVRVLGDEKISHDELRNKIGLAHLDGKRSTIIVGNLAEQTLTIWEEIIDSP